MEIELQSKCGLPVSFDSEECDLIFGEGLNSPSYCVRKILYLISFVLVLSLAGSAFAATIGWDGGGTGDDWTTANNWDGNAVPASSDNVNITGSAAVEVTTTTIPGESYAPSATYLNLRGTSSMTITSTGKYWSPSNMYIGCWTGEDCTVTVNSGGHLNSDGAIIMGYNGSDSTLNIYGQNDSTYLWVGRSSGSTCVVNYDTTATSLHRYCWIGDAGGGTLNMTSGTLIVEYSGAGNFDIAKQSGSTGTVNLDGGTIRCNDFSIGSGTGSMDVDGGTLIVDGDEETEIQGYITAGDITANGGTGTLNLDYNTTNAGKTTLSATPASDTTAPTPNPATFSSAPAAISDTAISMTATTGTDATGPVEYFFDETTGNAGGTDSGWQTSPSYTDSGLTASTQYSYTVQLRDSAATPNVGTASSAANATTQSNETDPPTPNPATFSSAPSADSHFAISMTATTGTDATGPVEYFFDETTGNSGGTDSGWQTSPSYTDSGLADNTQYSYTVQLRDSRGPTPNVGTASSAANATTDADTTAPTPNPATFVVAPAAGSCTEIYMTATTGTDALNPPVEYYFDETTGGNGATDSGWQTSPSYTDTGLDSSTQYSYTVQMRDSATTPNAGTVSSVANATTNPPSDDPFGPLPISSSTGVHVNLELLEWILPTGTGTITCDVVMGTDPVLDSNGFLDASDADNTLIVDGLSVESVDPGTLVMDTVYYWQVAIYDDGSPAGYSPLYKFKTFDRYMEDLDRGLIVMNIGDGDVYLGWRLFKSDPYDLGFNIYRNDVKLNPAPITDSTNYLDTTPNLAIENTYDVVPVYNEVEGADSTFVLAANTPIVHAGTTFDPAVYVSFPFTAAGGRSDTVERICTGDLDGDGKVDYVVQHPRGLYDPGPGPGLTSETYKYAAFDHDGTFKWEVDLGQNIVVGTWWSPMTVFDLDGDGKAEVIARTMPLTPDYRNPVEVWPAGAVLTGPEYFTIWDGDTGAVRATGDWIARGNVCDWGDCHGNRSERHQIGIAYLDGVNPSLLIIRGIYEKMVVEAWTFEQDDTLTKEWTWTRTSSPGGGFHSIRTGDVDGDGKDEIINGSICIDDDGTTLWDTGEGHGDRLQLADIDPHRAGLEVWSIQENTSVYEHPQHLRDADDGSLIWYTGDDTYGDNPRGLVADLDPTVDGLECWSAVSYGKLRSATGAYVSEFPTYAGSVMCGRAYWWGADLLRELEHYFGRIVEWDYINDSGVRVGTITSHANADVGVGDIFGDWREELIYRDYRYGEILVATPMTVTSQRLYTLRQDNIYRNDIASTASGYYQSAYTEFYMGSDMAAPTPATMSFSTTPAAASDSSITMTATTATAYGHGGVEYYFDCTTAGGHDSLWQTSRTYVDTNLDPNTTYSYRVKARGLSHWETAYSSTANTDTLAPPEPDIDRSGEVDILDLHSLAFHWLNTGCNGSAGDESDWCYRADVDYSTVVDIKDFAEIAAHWLE